MPQSEYNDHLPWVVGLFLTALSSAVTWFASQLRRLRRLEDRVQVQEIKTAGFEAWLGKIEEKLDRVIERR